MKEIKDCENKTIREIIQENILPEIEKSHNSEKEKRIKERTSVNITKVCQ